jgi:hypothetical protein
LSTLLDWWERVFIPDALPMLVQAAGTLYTFDLDTRRLSKVD